MTETRAYRTSPSAPALTAPYSLKAADMEKE